MDLRLFAVSFSCALAMAAAKPTCCWSKWGDASSCGDYTGSGGHCNTDGSKKCTADNDCSGTPEPSPAPAPPPSPPAPPRPSSGEVIGYWSVTWGTTRAPSGANLGIAFSGWNNPANAKSESEGVRSRLVGAKWIDAGGGDKNGRWNADFLGRWDSAIKSGSLKGWQGIVFDVEECYNAGLANDFAKVLRSAKSAGMKTLVTTSHSAPYGCSDAGALMHAFFSSNDVDYLSPQLYSSGEEGSPQFDDGDGVKWSDWAHARAAFVPSLSCASLRNGGYKKTQDYFAKVGIRPSGYIVWPSQGCTLAEEVMV